MQKRFRLAIGNGNQVNKTLKKLQKFSLTIFITIYRPQGKIFCSPFQLSRDAVIKFVYTPHACTYPCKSAGRLIVKPTIEMFLLEIGYE